MNLSKPQLVRIASNIRDRLRVLAVSREAQVSQKLASFVNLTHHLGTIQRKLNVCQTRNWQGAGAKVMSILESALRDVPYHLQGIERAVQACKIDVPSVPEIYEELVAADEEFAGLAYQKEGDLLAVSTDPIGLDGVYLGEFQIQLYVTSLADMRYNSVYGVVALDPHPATSNECVTHPHVSDERLCAGDAGAAIQAALTSGRICDFFVLVRSVLTHYNPSSPYVSLENWSGTPCSDCGYVASGDDLCTCSHCEEDFCSECSSYCPRCEETTCLGCLEKCSACEDPVCPSCTTSCPECGERLCKTCAEEEQCPCLEEKENKDDSDQTEDSEATPSGTAEAGTPTFDVMREAARATASTVGVDPA